MHHNNLLDIQNPSSIWMLDALLIADNRQILSLERENEHKEEQTLGRDGGIFPFQISCMIPVLILTCHGSEVML